MTKLNEIYKCEVCGNVVSVIGEGGGTLVCCDQEMKLMEEKTEDEGKEKHVPVIEKIEGGLRVKVGSVPHPMTEEHYISLIQLIKDGKVLIGKRLTPNDEPVADFCCLASTEGVTARIYCNVHGLWKN